MRRLRILHFPFAQMIVPSELEDHRGHQNHREGDGGALELPKHEIERKDDQRNLPNNADSNVQGIAREVPVALKARIFGKNLLQYGSPQAPWPHAPVESLEYFVVFRFAEQCAGKTTGQGEDEHQRKDNRDIRVDGVSSQK